MKDGWVDWLITINDEPHYSHGQIIGHFKQHNPTSRKMHGPMGSKPIGWMDKFLPHCVASFEVNWDMIFIEDG